LKLISYGTESERDAMSSSEKAQRQLAIKEIISQKDISSQEELARELALRGFEANQATLSRDLKELGIAKVSTPEGV